MHGKLVPVGVLEIIEVFLSWEGALGLMEVALHMKEKL
jgi:hypothetical protein